MKLTPRLARLGTRQAENSDLCDTRELPGVSYTDRAISSTSRGCCIYPKLMFGIFSALGCFQGAQMGLVLCDSLVAMLVT